MFGFIEKVLVVAMSFFSCSVFNVNSLKYVSMNNQEGKIRLEVISINSNGPLFYPYSNLVRKCNGSCNNINDPYAKWCVPDVAKSIGIKVFNLMSRTTETRQIGWYETSRCKCRLPANICNNKNRWNNEKCRCECKQLYVIKDVFGILVIVHVNVINHVT